MFCSLCHVYPVTLDHDFHNNHQLGGSLLCVSLTHICMFLFTVYVNVSVSCDEANMLLVKLETL